MAGTLSVQKIQGLASSATPTVVEVSSGHELHTNSLKGTTTAGSITVQGEGTATTNLQQGLIKCFMDLNGTGTIALRDSFNISSVADNGTGLYTVTIANDFSSANYGYAGSAESSVDGQNGRVVCSVSTQSLAGSTKLRAQQLDFVGADLPHIRVGWWGDLA